MIRGVLTATFAAVSLFCAQPAEAHFASLAFSSSTGELIATHDATTQAQSERDALGACKSDDCKIIFTTQAEWMAIAVSNSHEWGVSGAGTLQEAMEKAYNACLDASQTCHWRLWTHNSGNPDKDDTEEFMPGPNIHPGLAAIGGAFSVQLPNFKGFAQLHPDLCWAAALKTLYYNVTGLELSQWRLARLQVIPERFGREPEEEAVVPLRYVEGQCNNDTKSGCAGGSPLATLNYMGILLPLPVYPKTTDSVGIWRAIRRSLQAGYPAVIEIDWYTGQSHALVVWGATFAPRAGSTSGEASIALDIYDPEDDSFTRMISNAYHPRYEVIPGRFTGGVSLANFLSPATKDPDAPGKRVCVFLNSADHDRVCRQ